MSLSFIGQKNNNKNENISQSLFIRHKKILNHTDLHVKNRGIARYTCMKALLTIEAAVILPFFACFMVFILYFFRILQVQAGISQALQYTSRRIAAEYSIQTAGETTDAEDGKNEVNMTDEKKSKSDLLGMLRTELLFQKQLKKQNCPTKYIRHGTAGISLIQSDFSENYVDIKAVYQMKLPVVLLGDIQYRIVQEAKCRKWTGYEQGQDTQEDDTWLYYTEHGTVYHASRYCTHLDLSIHGVTYTQALSTRNKSGGKYHKCEKCGSGVYFHAMVYITDYGDQYHSSLACGGLKRSIYMIRRSKATEKRMCSKCGGLSVRSGDS